METLVYEKKISEKKFANTYGSEYLTTVLCVVPKKLKEKFQEIYQTCLITFNENDLANWEKRTQGAIDAANQNIEDEAQRKEIVQSEFAAKKAAHAKTLFMPGAVPSSADFLGQTDADGNELWRITTVRDWTNDYMRVLRNKGFLSQ